MKPDSGFERFYEKEAEIVFGAVFLLCRDRTLAEDATQEAFARALERWERLGHEPWAAGWVMTTALNVARRSRRARPLSVSIEEYGDVDDELDLWAAVRRLPRRQQETVVLHYRMGAAVQEIAQILGCEAGTVRTHLARARAALRTTLKGDPYGR